MEMLKKSYAESLESLLLPSKNGNHFINSLEKRKNKKKAKKEKCLANDYLHGERDSEAVQCVLITMD